MPGVRLEKDAQPSMSVTAVIELVVTVAPETPSPASLTSLTVSEPFVGSVTPGDRIVARTTGLVTFMFGHLTVDRTRK